MSVYYNEIDPKIAAWLRELIANNLIAKGEVDERSIEDVLPNELSGFTQHHFFAGVGMWSYALRLAGWPDNRPVWTGSCPCQPFSTAGKGAGFADERHLWPAWHWLIRQCRPTVVFGEQVASAKEWLDLVSTDVEFLGYAFAAASLPACGVGAPHIRQRVWWAGTRPLGDTQSIGHPRGGHIVTGKTESAASGGGERERCRGVAPGVTSTADALGNPSSTGLEERQSIPCDDAPELSTTERAGNTVYWSSAEWVHCTDKKLRPVKPGVQCLAHGVAERVVKLRGIGNAIVPQVAAEFIKILM